MKKRIIPLLSALLTVALLATLALFSGAATNEPELKIAYCTLEFGQDTHILYAVTSEGVENVEDIEVLVWRAPQTDYTGTPDVTLEFSYEETIGDDKCAVFEFTDLGAMNMADNYYACAHAKVDGEDIYSPINKYSVLQYAYNMLGKAEKTATYDAKLKDLLNSMLDYGSKVQTYANYKTDRLANANWYYINIDGGTLDDGFDHGLYLDDDEITVTVENSNNFSHWTDGNGNKLSTSSAYTTKVSDLIGDDDEKTVITINAEKKPSEGLEFSYYSDGTCYVSGIGICTDTDIVIPTTSPDGKTVTGIRYDAFYGCTNLTSVTIPNGVTSIGFAAFCNCTSLTSVTIGNGVTSIGWDAFDGCTSLTSIVIPDSVTSIDSGAFRGCTSLESITVASGNSVYHSAGNCLIETANKELVFGCKSSIIPTDGSITSIGDYAFLCCTSLESITIPDNVTSIGNSAFSGCTSLTSITIPDSVTSIGSDAFDGCSSLESIIVASGNSVYHSAGNCVIETAKKKLVFGCNSSVIPTDGSVTSIGDYAFWYCTNLTSITIPDSVTSIDEGAFWECTSLTSITIPDSVTSIGSDAFDGCSSLKKVYYTGTADEWSSISISNKNGYLTRATRYYYSKTEPTGGGNWWHYVDGVPTVWNVSTAPDNPSAPTYPRELTDDENWGGFWTEVSEGRFSCDDLDGNGNFAVLPIGKFESGKTKYTVSVKYEWDELRACGIMFAALDFDENGFIEDTGDMYHLILANGYIAHDYRGVDGWAGVWELCDINALGIEDGDIVKLTVVINTDTGVVEGYLNDTACGEWTVDLTGFGTWVGVCSKNVGAEYWDLEFAAE